MQSVNVLLCFNGAIVMAAVMDGSVANTILIVRSRALCLLREMPPGQNETNHNTERQGRISPTDIGCRQKNRGQQKE